MVRGPKVQPATSAVAGPAAVGILTFVVTHLQSGLAAEGTPSVMYLAPLGWPFALGVLVRWRGAAAMALGGLAALLLLGRAGDGWPVLGAAVAEVMFAAWYAGRYGVKADDAPRLAAVASAAAVARGLLVGLLLLATAPEAAPGAGLGTAVVDALGSALALTLFALAAREWARIPDERLRLLESAVVHARDAVIILAADPFAGPGRSVLYVNEAFTRMTGYTADEVVGRSLHFLRGPKSDPATLDRLRDALNAGTPLQVELLNYRKDGTEVWVELSLVPVPGPSGKRSHWVMIQRDVSDRKRAEAELREREVRLRVLGDNLPAGAVYQHSLAPDGTSRFTYVSAGVEPLTGRSPEEVLADPRALEGLYHSDDAARVRAAQEAAYARGETFDCEFRLFTTAGDLKWVHCRSLPTHLGDGTIVCNGVILDVTARKRADEALRRSEELFRGVFETAAAGVSLTGGDGAFVAVNPAFAAMIGRTPDELVDLSPREFTHPDDWKDEESLARELTAGRRESYQVRKRYLRPDGTTVWTELSVAAIRGPADEFIYGLGVSVDVTERRRLEEQLRQAQKMDTVGQMAGGIAHDFNNLLTGVVGNLALVDLRPGDPNRALIASAERAAQRAADLTRKLLGFARKNQLHVAPVRVDEFAREVLDILRRTFDPRIEVAADLDTPTPVLADATLVNQALLNLCLNARDAMPEGGRLEVRAEPVVVGPAETAAHPDARPGAFVRLTVSDSGCGMGPEVRARMFEPFFTTKPVGQGTGLGLAMVHGIVRQHHGWVVCESRPGGGTRFDLYLPQSASAVTPSGSVAVPRALGERAGGPPSFDQTPPPAGGRAAHTVLLVDDEELIRDLGRSVLETAGFRVLEATDGADAVDVFRREHSTIDLVILDLTMPRLSGRDAFRHLTGIDPDARILFSSGYSADDLSDVSGAVGLLAKPYRPIDLLAAVREALTIHPPLTVPAR